MCIYDIYPPLWNELMVRFWAPSWKHWALATDPQQNLPLSWHSQKPVSKVSLVPARCQNVFPFSVPRGGGFTTHLSSGTLDTGLEFDTLHWRQKLLLELTTMSQSSILSRFWLQNDLQNVTKNRWKIKLGRNVIFYTPLTRNQCFCCPIPLKKTSKSDQKSELKTRSLKICNFRPLDAPGRQLWAKRLPKCSQIDSHFAQDGRVTFTRKSSWTPLEPHMCSKWLQKPPETHFGAFFVILDRFCMDCYCFF